MIGKTLIKSLCVGVVAVAVASPVMSNASTAYTGKTPASIAMMAATTGVSVKTVSTLHKTKAKHVKHSALKKTSFTSKHKLTKKHVVVKAKKKA